jgi:hypothetical protein
MPLPSRPYPTWARPTRIGEGFAALVPNQLLRRSDVFGAADRVRPVQSPNGADSCGPDQETRRKGVEMAEIGLFLSSEEHGPKELVAQAQQGDAAGFTSVFISDHFHPWIDRQGESPFVWSVIGAISSTTGLKVTTGVTCPIQRIHPAIIAQAAATSSLLLDGRFVLGAGTGERL